MKRKNYLYLCNKKKWCSNLCNNSMCEHTTSFLFAKNKFKKRKYQIEKATDEKGDFNLYIEYEGK